MEGVLDADRLAFGPMMVGLFQIESCSNLDGGLLVEKFTGSVGKLFSQSHSIHEDLDFFRILSFCLFLVGVSHDDITGVESSLSFINFYRKTGFKFSKVSVLL